VKPSSEPPSGLIVPIDGHACAVHLIVFAAFLFLAIVP